MYIKLEDDHHVIPGPIVFLSVHPHKMLATLITKVLTDCIIMLSYNSLDDVKEVFDHTGVKNYIHECNQLGVIPVSYFKQHILQTSFVMRHHGLGPLGAKAIAKSLTVSTCI